ncbi:interferon-related developmental regulator-domain-containing protein [Aspergillus pseudodeflectus]|uniref:Interferon-related developmental regulator-domain-containing protein n=1 Tax=Aspergillus pseudodeflectus TaxID=176178 RepID=A0ABR4JUV2_9EURO
MPDLRRQVLESGKTISRKAASREGSRRTSRANSAQNSHHTSRNASRQASDDEDAGYLSDDTAISLGSLDEAETLDAEVNNGDWAYELNEVVEDILDRKRSSVLGREETYAAYCRLSKFHFVEELIRRRVTDLMAAFCRSIKNETSVRESTLAMRALELLTITASDYTIFENVEPLLSRTIRDSTSNAVKAAAIHCLGTCTMFGGAGDDGIQDQMTFLLDIVATDGQSIDAQDDCACVTAALQEWGFMATEIEDLENESEESIQIFMDQLTSGDSSVQVAAGENIALLYEKSYTPQEDDDDEGEDEDVDGEHDSDSDEGNFRTGPKLIKRYNAYHNTPELERQLQSLAAVHTKRISKRDKKTLHSNFASIRTTVANPRRGPMYNTAIDQNTNRHYGNKLTVKIGRQGVMHIDRWWKWIRLNALRRVLQGGFAVHYFQGNRAVLDSLPVVMVRMDTPADRNAPKKAAKMRQHRRWAKQEYSDDD